MEFVMEKEEISLFNSLSKNSTLAYLLNILNTFKCICNLAKEFDFFLRKK